MTSKTSRKLITNDGDMLTFHDTGDGYVRMTVTSGPGDFRSVSVGQVDPATIRQALDEVAPRAASASPRDQAAPEVDADMVTRAAQALHGYPERTGVTWQELTPSRREELLGDARRALTAALTPEPPRPEGAAELERALEGYEVDEFDIPGLADYLASRGVRVTSRYCGLGPFCLEDGHDGECKL